MMNWQEAMDKTFVLTETMHKNMWDMCRIGMGTISWSQQQYDNALKKQLEQNEQLRDETRKLVDITLKLAQKSQQHLQNMVQETMRLTLEKVK